MSKISDKFNKPSRRTAWEDPAENALESKIQAEITREEAASKKAPQMPTFSIAGETERKRSGVLSTLRAASTSLSNSFSSLTERFRSFKFNFNKIFKNRVGPMPIEDDKPASANKAESETTTPAQTLKRVIKVKEAGEKGLPEYSENIPAGSSATTEEPLPQYTEQPSSKAKNTERERPISPPPSYDPTLRNSSTQEEVSTLSPAPSYQSLPDLYDQEERKEHLEENPYELDTESQTEDGLEELDAESPTDDDLEELDTAIPALAPATTKIVMVDSQSQTSAEPDGLDKLFQEYRDFFRSSGEKPESTMLNISGRLERDFLLKDTKLLDDGTKTLNQDTSIRLKNFLENDPELKFGERKAIAGSLHINLLENGKVENTTKAEAKIDGLSLIRSIVASPEWQEKYGKKKEDRPGTSPSTSDRTEVNPLKDPSQRQNSDGDIWL